MSGWAEPDGWKIDLLGWEARGTVAELREALDGLPDDATVRATSCCCGEGLRVEIPLAGPPSPPPKHTCLPCKGTGMLHRYTGPRLTPLGYVFERTAGPDSEECPWCEGEGTLTLRIDRSCPTCHGNGWAHGPGADLGDFPKPCRTCRAIGYVLTAPF